MRPRPHKVSNRDSRVRRGSPAYIRAFLNPFVLLPTIGSDTSAGAVLFSPLGRAGLSLLVVRFLGLQDIPFIFGFLRAHSFPSEADFLGPSNANGVSSGFALRGSYRGVLFTDAAVGAPEGSLNQQARQCRREGTGVGLVLYLIAKLHSIPYFKGDTLCLLLSVVGDGQHKYALLVLSVGTYLCVRTLGSPVWWSLRFLGVSHVGKKTRGRSHSRANRHGSRESAMRCFPLCNKEAMDGKSTRMDSNARGNARRVDILSGLTLPAERGQTRMWILC